MNARELSPKLPPPLRRQLHVLAAQALALPNRRLERPVMVRDHDSAHEVLLVLMPRGHTKIPLPTLAGAWFSPDEQRIWDALAHGPLRGPALADVLGEELGGRLKAILSNMIERECIKSGPRGYFRNRVILPKPPKS